MGMSCTLMCNSHKHQLSNGHDMAQVVGHQPQTVEAPLQSQVSPCDTCGESDNKGKAIPLQTWTGPEGSRRLRLPDFWTVSI